MIPRLKGLSCTNSNRQKIYFFIKFDKKTSSRSRCCQMISKLINKKNIISKRLIFQNIIILSGMPESCWISIEITFWILSTAMLSSIYFEGCSWASSCPNFLIILTATWANIFCLIKFETVKTWILASCSKKWKLKEFLSIYYFYNYAI